MTIASIYSFCVKRVQNQRAKKNSKAAVRNSNFAIWLVYALLSIALIISLTPARSFAMDESDIPLTTDNRIKTYIYSPNEIYLMVLRFGFQSHIEFAVGEEIQTISLGDAYAWEITPLANRLFIKPMAKNIRTNMTIITSKRTYQFDIVSEDVENHEIKDL
ncbi:MAG: TrbG/VirB9 family P-type conjugative transfer protein, partial [Pseudomonadota bacterium]